jgi:hypothetical protein
MTTRHRVSVADISTILLAQEQARPANGSRASLSCNTDICWATCSQNKGDPKLLQAARAAERWLMTPGQGEGEDGADWRARLGRQGRGAFVDSSSFGFPSLPFSPLARQRATWIFAISSRAERPKTSPRGIKKGKLWCVEEWECAIQWQLRIIKKGILLAASGKVVNNIS